MADQSSKQKKSYQLTQSFNTSKLSVSEYSRTKRKKVSIVQADMTYLKQKKIKLRIIKRAHKEKSEYNETFQ